MTEQALKTEIASLRAHVAGLENQLKGKDGECKHEWRQKKFFNFEDVEKGARYYCIHCRKEE